MSENEVILILCTLVSFVISIASVGVRFTKAIGEVKAATEALRDAVGELRRATAEIKNENRSDHAEFNVKIGQLENRVVKIETAIMGL